MPYPVNPPVAAAVRPRLVFLYVLALLREFRWTLAGLSAAVLFGAVLYAVTPHENLGGHHPSLLISLYAAWMALLNQPLYNPPQTWYLTILCALYPLLGAVLIGEGVVRLALLMMSRRGWQKEWVKVMASTYRDHVVLCGLGHLGFKVLEQLVASHIPVVVLERRRNAKFIVKAKELKVPVLIRDMKEDQALIDAGIKHARSVIIATNNAVANLEVALDSRRMNPTIRVVMRMFDAQIASKISSAMHVDIAFSSSTLAAPVIAALALQQDHAPARILSTCSIAGVPYVTVEVPVAPNSLLVNHRISEIESAHTVRVLAHVHAGSSQCHPSADTMISHGDVVVLHLAASELGSLQ